MDKEQAEQKIENMEQELEELKKFVTTKDKPVVEKFQDGEWLKSVYDFEDTLRHVEEEYFIEASEHIFHEVFEKGYRYFIPIKDRMYGCIRRVKVD